MLKKAEILRLKQVDHIISENTILSHINHPFLVDFALFFLFIKIIKILDKNVRIYLGRTLFIFHFGIYLRWGTVYLSQK